jgi:hypothetical protein
MAQSLAKILIHTVFSTKDRRPFLRDKSLREEMHQYLGGILARHDCQPIIIGGVEDHVHIRSCVTATLGWMMKRRWRMARYPSQVIARSARILCARIRVRQKM